MGRVVSIIEGAIRQNGVALAVSIDIANAFNSLPWKTIREGLERHKLPGYLKRIINNYLTGRTVEYKGKSGYTHRETNRGIPQGSVLGPLLWNLGYDIVLSTVLPTGVYATCYADDTLLACGREWTRTIRTMEVGLAALVQRITSLDLA